MPMVFERTVLMDKSKSIDKGKHLCITIVIGLIYWFFGEIFMPVLIDVCWTPFAIGLYVIILSLPAANCNIAIKFYTIRLKALEK